MAAKKQLNDFQRGFDSTSYKILLIVALGVVLAAIATLVEENFLPNLACDFWLISYRLVDVIIIV